MKGRGRWKREGEGKGRGEEGRGEGDGTETGRGDRKGRGKERREEGDGTERRRGKRGKGRVRARVRPVHKRQPRLVLVPITSLTRSFAAQTAPPPADNTRSNNA